MLNIGKHHQLYPIAPIGKNEWKPAIVISPEREGIVTSRPYRMTPPTSTEEAADNHGIKLGQLYYRRKGS